MPRRTATCMNLTKRARTPTRDFREGQQPASRVEALERSLQGAPPDTPASIRVLLFELGDRYVGETCID